MYSFVIFGIDVRRGWGGRKRGERIRWRERECEDEDDVVIVLDFATTATTTTTTSSFPAHHDK